MSTKKKNTEWDKTLKSKKHQLKIMLNLINTNWDVMSNSKKR
jgi:hypothetical protein